MSLESVVMQLRALERGFAPSPQPPAAAAQTQQPASFDAALRAALAPAALATPNLAGGTALTAGAPITPAAPSLAGMALAAGLPLAPTAPTGAGGIPLAAGAPVAPAAPTGAGGTALATPSSGQYPHLRGDLDASPEILDRLEALAARRGEVFTVTSGTRTIDEQQRLWDNRASNPNPVAPPGRSLHHSGRAADVAIDGRPIQTVISADELRRAGLVPLAGDPPHVQLP
jgi:hypothetical protein